MADGRRTCRTLAAGLAICVSASAYDHLRPQSTVGDILRHPAFAGFARLILPWDGRAYDEGLALTGIGSLLPYHSHVDPDTVASALLSAGVESFRTTPVRDSPRAPYCLMGVCFDCLVTIDGVGSRQSCLVPVRDGMLVETQLGKREAGR